MVQDEVVVVAGRLEAGFLVSRAHRSLLREVERRAFHALDLAGRNQAVVHRRVLVGVEPQFVSEDVAGAGQVEIAVIREVDWSGFVGSRFIVDAQFIPVRERVKDRQRQIAGIAFLTIKTEAAHFDSD